jgi:hypothetical protein
MGNLKEGITPNSRSNAFFNLRNTKDSNPEPPVLRLKNYWRLSENFGTKSDQSALWSQIRRFCANSDYKLRHVCPSERTNRPVLDGLWWNFMPDMFNSKSFINIKYTSHNGQRATQMRFCLMNERGYVSHTCFTLYTMTLIQTIFKNSLPTSQKTPYISILKTKRLMLFNVCLFW